MKTLFKICSVLMLIGGVASVLFGGVMLAGLWGWLVLDTLCIFYIITGAFDIIAGIFGLRVANDPTKKTPAVIFGTLAAVGALIGLVIALFTGSSLTESVAVAVVPLLYFLCAASISANGNKR